MNILDVTPDNVDQLGFFCLMSRRQSEGWRRKRRWLEARFAEGLRIKMLDLSEGGRGFIEYLPGESAWRPVEAAGWTFIHCLWVVGKSKGKGYGSRLIEACLSDAEQSGTNGVAMVTSEGNWLAGRKLLLRHGFGCVDRAPPAYELLTRAFASADPPSFPDDWEERAARFGSGLTVIRTDQCPYLDDAAANTLELARDRGIEATVVELDSAAQIRERSPSPYGVFTILLDGKVLSHSYQPAKKLSELLDSALAG